MSWGQRSSETPLEVSPVLCPRERVIYTTILSSRSRGSNWMLAETFLNHTWMSLPRTNPHLLRCSVWEGIIAVLITNTSSSSSQAWRFETGENQRLFGSCYLNFVSWRSVLLLGITTANHVSSFHDSLWCSMCWCVWNYKKMCAPAVWSAASQNIGRATQSFHSNSLL